MEETDKMYTSAGAEKKRAQLVKAAIESAIKGIPTATVETCQSIVDELT